MSRGTSLNGKVLSCDKLAVCKAVIVVFSPLEVAEDLQVVGLFWSTLYFRGKKMTSSGGNVSSNTRNTLRA